MPKRIAMTIAGAVSLGSYEAGVTYELLEVLRWHNAQAADDAKIFIDVITGASAGGMTAAMLGEWLMFRGDAMQSVDGNPLYQAWVKKISLKKLVRLGSGEGKWASLFSSGCVAGIGTEMLVASMQGDGPWTSHPCLAPGGALRIGMAMTNLNGVDYQIPITGNDDGGFNYTRSVDQRMFLVCPDEPVGPKLLTPDGDVSDASWEVLRNAAVACGAFPAAFRPQQIARVADEYVTGETPQGPAQVPPDDPGKTYVLPDALTDWSFVYTDGGVLQNQPLGIAKSLVDMAVRERLGVAQAHLAVTAAVDAGGAAAVAADHAVGTVYRDSDDRVYVFVSPHSVRNAAVSLKAENLGLSRILPEVLRVYLRQAAFQDWIMAERTNRDIRLLDQRAHDLALALERGQFRDVDGFVRSAENLDELLLKDGQDATFTRLRHQYHELYLHLAGLENGTQLALAFVSGIAALEAAAQLHSRDAMNVIAVLADGAKELAGSGLSAFAGFFSEKFREHDYWVGRTKAHLYFRRQDVCTLLGIDQAAMGAYLDAHPIADPVPSVVVPLSLWATLRAGGVWLLYGLLIRWEILAVLAVVGALLVGLGVLGCRLLFHP